MIGNYFQPLIEFMFSGPNGIDVIVVVLVIALIEIANGVYYSIVRERVVLIFFVAFPVNFIRLIFGGVLSVKVFGIEYISMLLKII